MEKIKNHFNYRIEKDPLSMVPIEIIIPFYGQTHLVAKLLDGIFKTVRDTKYLITLVDDCSPNADFLASLIKAKVPGVRGIRNLKHSGFGYSINQALRNPFFRDISLVAIMHSDVQLENSTWLYNLNKSLSIMKDQNVKMVTAMTDNPTSELSRLVNSQKEVQEDFILDEDEFIPMYCCIANRELFNRVGPILECPFAGSEAKEFNRRMRKAGYLQGVSGSSWVRHEGEGTLRHLLSNEKVQNAIEDTKKKVFG